MRTEAEHNMTSKEAHTGQKVAPRTQRWHTSLRVAGTITTVPTNRSASDSDTMKRLLTVRSFLSLATAANTSRLPARVTRVSSPKVTAVATEAAVMSSRPGSMGTSGALVMADCTWLPATPAGGSTRKVSRVGSLSGGGTSQLRLTLSLTKMFISRESSTHIPGRS